MYRRGIYGTTMSSIGGPSSSMPEVLKPTMFPNPQSAPVSLPMTTLLTSPALPQGLPVHHYSQPTLPLGHFANMISYNYLTSLLASGIDSGRKLVTSSKDTRVWDLELQQCVQTVGGQHSEIWPLYVDHMEKFFTLDQQTLNTNFMK